jgi:hypothetical protein
LAQPPVTSPPTAVVAVTLLRSTRNAVPQAVAAEVAGHADDQHRR